MHGIISLSLINVKNYILFELNGMYSAPHIMKIVVPKQRLAKACWQPNLGSNLLLSLLYLGNGFTDFFEVLPKPGC